MFLRDREGDNCGRGEKGPVLNLEDVIVALVDKPDGLREIFF
jgi:hypothetical protein